jgi:hypothetical protein
MSASAFAPAISGVDELSAEWLQLSRQVAHWTMAAERLINLHEQASATAWDELERYLGIVLRQKLIASVNQLRQDATGLRSLWYAARTQGQFQLMRQRVTRLRQQYLRTETLLDFYSDAINTRTNPDIAAILRACDVLTRQSMVQLLEPLGKATPPVLTYLDKGLGASILKAGLRLWDGNTQSQVAAIKIVRHNLYRPTALIHEAGHQVAHILGWNQELAKALAIGLASSSPSVAEVWESWASEVAADAFAFVHTGYAAVANLHDVVDAGGSMVFRYRPGDPHPTSYIRVLLGTEMCQRYFGDGPWNALAEAWVKTYPLRQCRGSVRDLLEQSMPLLPRIVDITMTTPMRAFGGQSLAALIPPARVAPAALRQLEQQGGDALYTSSHWVWSEPLRLLALTGYRAATAPERAVEVLHQQRSWMLRLGNPDDSSETSSSRRSK